MESPASQHSLRTSGQMLRTTLRTPGVSLRHGRKDEPAKAAPSAVNAEASPRDNSYTASDIVKAWEAYINAHGTMHLLVNAMRMAVPTIIEGKPHSFNVSQNSVQIGFINEYLPDITRSVRNAVGNDAVTFVLTEVNEDSPLAWNDRELMAHIIEDTPSLAAFAKALQLKLL